jgi:hypothetical protein
MQIPIFKREISDGLEAAIASQNSVAYCSPLTMAPERSGEVFDPQLMMDKDEVAIAENLDQIDLFYLSSILVSTGWNKNDDVFTTEETWAARNTPEDKQFNFMHDENDIIGHITGSYVVDRQGEKIVASEAPSDFDIVANAVIYNSWSKPENIERVQTLIAEIKEGKWKVSMECLFAGFDYAVVTPDGSHKILARSEESSFLTKHLRAYGGDGMYDGFKVGRALRSIAFSGKGLVSNPANPRSIILNETRAFTATTAGELSNFNDLGDRDMADAALQSQVDSLKAELAQAKKDAEDNKKKFEEKKKKESEAQVAALEASIQAITEEKEAIAEELKTAEATIAELTTAAEGTLAVVEDLRAKVAAFEVAEKTAARTVQLTEAGIVGDKVAESLESLSALDDAAFATVVSLMATTVPASAAEEEVVEEVAAEEAEEVVEETEAEEVLDGVETTEAALVTPEPEEEAVSSAMASWYSENFLNKA